MAKNSKVHHRKSFTIPVLAIAGFGPVVSEAWRFYQAPGQGLTGAIKHVVGITTGYDSDTHSFHFENLKFGLVPIVVGFAGHYLIGQKLGINRMLGRAGIPFIRL